MEIKLCQDCKYCKGYGYGGNDLDLATLSCRVSMLKCGETRNNNSINSCGIEAKWFEQKEGK